MTSAIFLWYNIYKERERKKKFMTNFRHFPDEGIKEFRFEEDIEYIVVKEEDWQNNIIYGFTSTSYWVARQYINEHPDTNWVLACI